MALSISKKIWCYVWIAAAWWCVIAVDGKALSSVRAGDDTYREDILVSDISYPHGLAVDYSTHTVYFSYYNNTWFNAKVDYISKVFTAIEELDGMCWYTVDQRRQEVHAGCIITGYAPGGLYQWDSNTGKFEVTGEAGQFVNYVNYYNDTLYYTLTRDSLLRTYIKGQSTFVTALPSKVYGMVFDAYGRFVFYNNTGLYRRKRDGTEEMSYKEYEKLVSGLAVDGNGAVYTCNNDDIFGISRLHDRDVIATRLLKAVCTGITFDADDNIIYGDRTLDRIVHLVKC